MKKFILYSLCVLLSLSTIKADEGMWLPILINKLKNVDLDIQDSITKLNRQFLHAKTLGFIHPQTKKEMIFSSLLPQDLNNILKMLRNTEE